MRILYFPLLVSSFLVARTLATDTISTNEVSTCLTSSDVEVRELSVTYTRSTREVVFNIDGTSKRVQNVTASLTVTAYGNQVYSKDFDPCSSENYVAQLCPGTYHPSAEAVNQYPLIYAQSPQAHLKPMERSRSRKSTPARSLQLPSRSPIWTVSPKLN